MANYTPNLNLRKPLTTKKYDMVADLNDTKDKIDTHAGAVDAQLAENTNKLSDGWTHADNLGVVKYTTEAEARGNIATSTNAQLVNTALSEGKKILFGDGYYPFESEMNIQSTKNGLRGTFNTSRLIFPNTRGVVFTEPTYFGGFVLKGLSITSQGHCIDFENDNINCPRNFYQGIVEDLVLLSENGHCVYGGKNSTSGDQRVFEQVFKNINVCAPNGSGFYGFNGLGIVFDYCRDRTSIKNVFENCGGKFININTSFAKAEYFLFYNADAPAKYGTIIDMENCNVELVKKGIIGSVNSAIHVSPLRLDNVSFIPLIENGVKLTTYPVNIANILSVDIRQTSFSYNSTNFDTSIVKAPIKIFGNQGYDIKRAYGAGQTYFSEANGLLINTDNLEGDVYSALTSQWGKSKFPKYKEIHANYLSGGRKRRVVNITGMTNVINDSFIDEVVFNIGPTTNSLQYLSINDVGNSTFLVISNHVSSTADLKIVSNAGYNNRIVLNGVADNNFRGLPPGESVLLINKKNGSQRKWVEIAIP